MSNKILTIILATHFLHTFFIHALSDAMQFFMWNFYLQLHCFLLALLLTNQLSYKDQKLKSFAFVATIFSGYNLVDFVAEWLVSETVFYNYVVVIFAIILYCGVLPFAALIICRSLMPSGTEYVEGNSYLVYKKPNNWSGLLGLAFQAPYGHCALITEGQIFKFKKGELIEEKYIEKKEDLHIKILPVKLEEAQKLLGMEWSLNNNCFNVFKKFK